MVPGRLEDSGEIPEWMQSLRGFENLTLKRRIKRITRGPDGVETEEIDIDEDDVVALDDADEAGGDEGRRVVIRKQIRDGDDAEPGRRVVRKEIHIGDEDEHDEDVWEIRLRLPATARDVLADTDPLIPVHTIGTAVREIEGKLADLVKVCREEGKTWTEIGRALGVSKQAAWERYSGED